MSHMAEYSCCSSVAFERPNENTFTFTFPIQPCSSPPPLPTPAPTHPTHPVAYAVPTYPPQMAMGTGPPAYYQGAPYEPYGGTGYGYAPGVVPQAAPSGPVYYSSGGAAGGPGGPVGYQALPPGADTQYHPAYGSVPR